jgi:hypothetical protein
MAQAYDPSPAGGAMIADVFDLKALAEHLYRCPLLQLETQA